jgi:hypothetical protein
LQIWAQAQKQTKYKQSVLEVGFRILPRTFRKVIF